MADVKSFEINGTELMIKDEYARQQLDNIANKTVVENGKLYLVRKDGTKIDTGTTLPTSSSGSGIDGREVELQKGTDYIQWRYVGDTDWNNLVALNDLRGAKGDKGDTGLSAYELAQQETGFAGTLEQWLNSLVGTTPNLQIGDVTTLESGSNATASITGTAENPILNLGLPQGLQGEGGAGSSSEKEWKLICDLILEEDVSQILLETDSEGNPFSCKELLISANIHHSLDSGTKSIVMGINNKYTHLVAIGDALVSTIDRASFSKIKNDNGFLEHYYAQNNGSNIRPLNRIINATDNVLQVLEGNIEKLYFYLNNANKAVIKAGSHLVIYGR